MNLLTTIHHGEHVRSAKKKKKIQAKGSLFTTNLLTMKSKTLLLALILPSVASVFNTIYPPCDVNSQVCVYEGELSLVSNNGGAGGSALAVIRGVLLVTLHTNDVRSHACRRPYLKRRVNAWASSLSLQMIS